MPKAIRAVVLAVPLLASACAWIGDALEDSPRSPGWLLVFADEFEGSGPPDPTKWTPELGYVRNEEAQYYTARRENLRVENGALVIEAHKERYQRFDYTSASITTINHRHFLYGRIEVRAKIPAARGTWPAAWLRPADIDQIRWPTSGEIDIMEHVGHEPNRIYGTVHTPAYNHILGNARGAGIEIEAPWAEFHVYAIEWSPDRIDFLVDDRRYFSFANEGGGEGVWPFDKPYFLILNLAIGGNWGGERGIDDASFPQQYVIDYVRVYQLDLSTVRRQLRHRRENSVLLILARSSGGA